MSEPNTRAVGGPLDGSVGQLVPCPLCGEDKGYTLREGSTYRWWWVRCNACCSDLAECSSDRRTTTGQPLPQRWPSADTAWNEQGRHAQHLRAAIEEADRIMGHDDAATEWRERWAHLWPNDRIQPTAVAGRLE